MFPQQSEQCPVVIIFYMGYSPPKCTCNGNQTHSSKYMILLECLHDMNENATHLFPLLEPSLTPSLMPKPNVRKILFSKQKVFVLENILPNFDKIYWTTLQGEFVGELSETIHGLIRLELLNNLPTQFSGKSSIEIPFTTIFVFHFLSCHALTPIILGCPGAYEMHYVISKQFMLIYKIMHILT